MVEVFVICIAINRNLNFGQDPNKIRNGFILSMYTSSSLPSKGALPVYLTIVAESADCYSRE